MDRSNPLVPPTRFERLAEAVMFVVLAFGSLLVLQSGLYVLVQVPTSADKLLGGAIGGILSFAGLYVGRLAIWRVIFAVRGG